MLYTAHRETGTFIDEVETIIEGRTLIREYEEADRRDGFYEPNYYDIVDENHCSVDWR